VRNLVEGKWNFELVKRNKCPPWGLWGGAAGEDGMYLLREPGEREFRAARGVHRPVPVGSEVIVRTGGGGGWGDPLERNPNAVRADVREEFVSTQAARERYGVVLCEDLSIDHVATERARTQLRSTREHARRDDPGKIA
jgi:N-methylhydantoinase B